MAFGMESVMMTLLIDSRMVTPGIFGVGLSMWRLIESSTLLQPRSQWQFSCAGSDSESKLLLPS